MEILSFATTPANGFLAGPRARPADSRVRRLGKCATVTPAMQEVLGLVSRMAATDVTVTFLGETGTGKDVLAHALHGESGRAAGPFVVFDCGAVPPNLAESELFGHERGAFTGALVKHTGAFERASGGTLFLDEVGELPLELQPKLLRVLESRRVRRVGGTREETLDVRVVAATNRDLAQLVGAKQFRQDLYFRLAAAVIRLPALRDRLDDLPLLVPRVLQELGRGEVSVTDEAFDVLSAQGWPGNVRELKNTLACALAFVDGYELEPRHLRLFTPAADDSLLRRLPLGGLALAEIEAAAISQTLAQTRGNKIRAARLLGIAVSTLYEKLKTDEKPEAALNEK